MSLAHLTARTRRAPAWTLTLAGASAATFVSLAVLVSMRVTDDVDLAVIYAFQSIASYLLDVVVNVHTVVGQVAITLPIAIVIAFIAQRRLGGYAWLGPLFILGTGAVEVVFKSLIAHSGPPLAFIRVLPVFGNPLGVPTDLRPPFSFPSGHVARVTFLALVLASTFHSRAAWIVAVAVIAFSVFARVYIGDHWISDALAGLALGGGAGALAVGWMRSTARR